MKISLFTVVFPDLAAEEICSKLAEYGYDGVDWRIHDEFHVAPEQLNSKIDWMKSTCADHGLAMPMLGTYLNYWQDEQIREMAEAAANLGSAAVRVCCPVYEKDKPWQSQADDFRRHADGWPQLLKELPVRVYIEIHHGTITPSPSATRRLIDGLDPAYLGVIYDPGNMVNEGHENPRMAIDILGEYLAYVHVKNVGWRQDHDKQWTTELCDIDKGIVDWPHVIEELQDVNYCGWLTLEHSYGFGVPTTGLIGEDTYSQSNIPDLDKRLAVINQLQKMIQE